METTKEIVNEIEQDLRKAIEFTNQAYEDFMKSLRPLTSVQMYRVVGAILLFPQLKATTPKKPSEKIAMAAGMTFINAKIELAKVGYLYDSVTNNTIEQGGENDGTKEKEIG